MIIFSFMTMTELSRVLKDVEKELNEVGNLIEESSHLQDKTLLSIRYDDLQNLHDEICTYLGC